MTKTQMRKTINKEVYGYAAELGYEMYDDGDGSTVTFAKPEFINSDDSINYGRSTHNAVCLNWANENVKEDTKKINKRADELRIAFGI